jgi:hypothetical protein
VARFNVPSGELLFNDAALTAGEPVADPTVINNVSNLVAAGTNVLAVQLFNANTTSSDLFLEASLTGTVDDVGPLVANQFPAAGSVVRELIQIEVIFNEPVTGVGAADLLVNNSPATNLLVQNSAHYIFEFTPPATGMVAVAFAPSHGITDLSPMMNAFGGASWTITLNPNAAVAGVVINEFMAENQNGIRDEDGDTSDWIELFNGSAEVVNLEGWYLTDTVLDLTKWRIPNVAIASSGYLLIWASEKNRTNPLALHTNFRLNDSGEFLALVDQNTNVVSAFIPTYPRQSPDVSYGRDRSDPTIVGYYTNATPRAANATTGAGVLPEVQFSRIGSTFVEPFDLELSVDDTNAVIRFLVVSNAATASTNVFLTASSPLYTAPIPVAGTVQVRARAFPKSGVHFPGPIRSENYIRLNTNVLNFSSDLPLIIIHNFGQGAYPQSQAEFNSVVAVFEPGYGRSSLTNTPVLTTRAGINLRGSSTLGYAKSSFAVEFWNEFTDDTDKPLLDMPEESDWVFYAPNNFEPVLFHNPLFFQISRDVGRYAPRTRFAEVFVNTGTAALATNHYNGVYVVTEKVKRAPGRVDIPNLEPEDTNAPAITGGYLLSIDRQDSNERSFSTAGQPNVAAQSVIYVDPKGPDIQLPQRDPQEQYIIRYFNTFCTNLSLATYTNVPKAYEQYIDVDSWIDHIHINAVALNVDGLRLSGYFFKDRERRIEMGPVWDCDRCMGSTDGRDFQPRTWRGIGGDAGTDFFNDSNTFGNPWYRRLFRDIDFWQRYVDRYQGLRQGPLHLTNIFARIDQFAAELAEAQPREFNRWRVQPRGTNGTGNGTYATEVQWKKNWFNARLNFMDTNFLDRPQLNLLGGMISAGTMLAISPAAKAGSWVIYTLDGTDPRAPFGGMAPGAFSNLGPVVVTITNNVRVFARSFNPAHRNLTGVNNPPLTTPWSGPTEATYYTHIPALRITEIMYNPQDPPPGNTNDPNNFEYIELKNVGTTPLNLNRFRLRGGIEFDFPNLLLPAGSNVLVVANLAAFQSRYGVNTALIAGVFSNNLANEGERIILEGGLREPIHDFSYNDQWYPITDGFGFSLAIVDANAPLDTWGLKESWRPSGRLGGSPGTDDPAPPAFAQVIINEVLTHSDPPPPYDSVELRNLSSSLADIGHWFLTDNFREPKKYRIPGGTTLAGNGLMVFDETQFNFSNPARPFSLDSLGEEVYLFSGDANGNLTGYFHGFDFGAAKNGATFGRYVISTGDEQFPPQMIPTLNMPNGGPLVGPVVINEIMYHPPDLLLGTNRVNNTEDEYIELQNFGSSPALLYDPARPANTWHLRNAVDFDFPPNVSLPPGEHLLVVNFNPTNTAQLAAFRARHGVPVTVPIFGPMQGNLDNAGERIELRRPDVPEPPGPPHFGLVPSLLVEAVRYSDLAPWPIAANGLGPSLQRVVATSYGNDPTNWVAAAKTPGSAYGGGELPLVTTHPTNLTVIAFMNATFSVTAGGAGPFSYQWLFNGNPIPGATSATLLLTNVQPAQAGLYQAVVLNPANSTASSNALLTVLIPPNITAHPVERAVLLGGTAIFSVAATSSTPIRYQWRKNGANIPGATGSTLTLNEVQESDDALYDVVLTDDVGPVVSRSARLIVLVLPEFLEPPLPPVQLTVAQGSDVTFGVRVRGTLPMSYRWRRGGTTLANYYPSFSHTSFHTITNVQPPLTGSQTNITVILTNAAFVGSSILRTNAVLIVLPDTDGDDLPDEFETPARGLDPNNPADGAADFDGDGHTNLEEYIAGTDHQDPNSHLRVESVSLDTLDNAALLNFVAVSNRNYTVLYRQDADSGIWEKLVDVVYGHTNRLIQVSDPAPGTGEPRRVYRLVTPQFP